jgi:oxygen-independent coproporphyrinogen-3 oxidase
MLRKQAGLVEPAGIYIHIPFCIRKCPYCDFYSITDLSLQQSFMEALLGEMELAPRNLSFDTLYIGGGTPSVLDVGSIGRLIEAAHKHFTIRAYAEITIEVNPGTTDIQQLKAYRCAGVNRVNIGAQSFHDNNLRFLGRIHSAEDAGLAIQQAREAGFENIGLDLIYGLPGQEKDAWRRDLACALEYAPEHLSCYMLTYESGTPLDQDRTNGRFKVLDPGLAGDLFETTIEFLSTRGYQHYEVSNFSRTARTASRHNQKYWDFTPYIGLGPSAHSFINNTRYWNYCSVEKYIGAVHAGKHPVDNSELLTYEQQMIEAVYLGLRTTAGIDMNAFDKRFDTQFRELFKTLVDELKTEGFINTDSHCCALTVKGMRFLDSITSQFVCCEWPQKGTKDAKKERV